MDKEKKENFKKALDETAKVIKDFTNFMIDNYQEQIDAKQKQIDQTQSEIDDLEGKLDEEKDITNLGDVVDNKRPGRTSETQKIFFLAGGMPVQAASDGE